LLWRAAQTCGCPHNARRARSPASLHAAPPRQSSMLRSLSLGAGCAAAQRATQIPGGHLPEQVRRADRTGRILPELGSEVRVGDGLSEVLRELPDGVIEEHAAVGDAAMELRGDEAGLALEVGGVSGPRREELLHVLWVGPLRCTVARAVRGCHRGRSTCATRPGAPARPR
jgi:hypothetical protein